MAVARPHERADRGRRRVVDRDLVLLHDLPVAAPRRVLGSALVDHAGGVVLQRPVDDVGVPRHPADVGRAPVDVVVANVEHQLVGHLGAEQVARRRVQDPLGLCGRTRGVEQEQHVLGVHSLRLAPLVRARNDVVIPVVATLDPADLLLRASHDEHVLDRGAVAQRLVGGGLERHDAALAPAAVGGDQQLALGVVDATRERLRGEAAEHDGVRGPDAGAGQQRHRQLRHHAEVDRDAIPLAHAEAAQDIGQAVDLVVQLAIADDALVAGLADPDVGGLVAAAGREVPVEAVDRGIQLAVGEPLVEGRVGVVEALRRLAVPVELVERALHPERDRIGLGLGVDRLVGDTGARLELRRRREDAALLE